MDDALNVLQRASRTSAAAAVNKLVVRIAAGSGRLAELVRNDQDLAAETDTLDKSIVAAISREPSKRDAGSEERIRHRLASIVRERDALHKVFAAEFSTYATLSDPNRPSAKEIQRLLSTDEALVAFSMATRKATSLPQPETFRVARSRTALQTLSQQVVAFRYGLDVEALSRGLERVECTQAEADRRGLAGR